MKLDLARYSCLDLMVRIPIPSDFLVAEKVESLLPGGLAYGRYSKNREAHGVIARFASSEDGSFMTVQYLAGDGAAPPNKHGDVFGVLDALGGRVATVVSHVHAHFVIPNQVSASRRLRLKLPVSLFSSGAFPFEELRGYRAAKVDGSGKTIWTAVVDQEELENDLNVGVTLAETTGSSFDGLLRECCGIVDALFTEGSDDR